MKEIIEKAHEEHAKTLKSRNIDKKINTFYLTRRKNKKLKPTF